MTTPRLVHLKCPVNSLPCRNSTQCYRQMWACDGIRDCPFADDELGCYQGSNRTMERGETNAGGGGGDGRGDKAKTPYGMELGFLIFVMAGGLLFLLFLWWLCNISVHKRGRRRTGCMEALVADLKDRTWKSDLFEHDEFPEDNVHRSLRQETVERPTVGNFLVYNPQSFRGAETLSTRCSDRLQGQILQAVDEIRPLTSPRRGPSSHTPLPILTISRPPSYNSCLNTGNAVTADVMVRHSNDNIIINVPENHVRSSDVRSDGDDKQMGVLCPDEDGAGASDLLPSYDEVTRETGEGLESSRLERIPSYPPAYREVVVGATK